MAPTRLLPLLALFLVPAGCDAPASAAPSPEAITTTPSGHDVVDHAATCAPVRPLRCGEVVTGDTSDWNDGATDVLDFYPVAVGNYSGPELVYWFDPGPDREVTFSLVDPEPTETNHDLFVLDARVGCSNAAAVATGFNQVSFEADPGARYYLVVDGFDGDAGEFALRVDCAEADAPPVEEPEPAEDCAFGSTTWEAMGSSTVDWTGPVQRWTRAGDMPDLAADQLDVGWEHFAGDGGGLHVWDLVDAGGVRMDRLAMPGGPAFDWIRIELRAGARLGWIFFEGTLEMVAWDADDEIHDCRVDAPR